MAAAAAQPAPQRALDLLAVDPTNPDPTNPDPDSARPDPATDPATDPAVCTAEDAMYAGPDPFARPAGSTGRRGSGGEAVLLLHLTDRDLLAKDADGAMLHGRGGVARCDKLGPVLLKRLHDWLINAGKVNIRPVIDPTDITAVDRHDPPDPMAEAVRLREETCVFPHCGRPSARCDLDHIHPYVDPDQGGPPGQTRPVNLAPVCRRHHRARTHADFTYRRLPDGSSQWTLRTGHQVTTDPPTPRPRPRP